MWMVRRAEGSAVCKRNITWGCVPVRDRGALCEWCQVMLYWLQQ